MKASAIACAVLAGTLGFSSLASAQDWGHRGDARHEQRDERHEQRRDWNGRHDQRRDWNEHRREWNRQPRYVTPRYEAPRYYSAPGYYGYRTGPRFYRGGYVPYQYMQPSYYVDWQAYPGLYAPPYGYQWMQVGDDFLLVALATGLIANLLTR